MKQNHNLNAAETETVKRQNQALEVLRRMAENKGAMFGLVILVLVIVLAVLAPAIIPYPFDAIDMNSTFLKPCAEHWFGTDHLGRDVFSRILYGAKYSLILGIGSVLVGSILGIIVGAISGFFGGAVDQVIMRICDVVQSIPGMILNIALACVLGAGVFNTILALGIADIAGAARLMRASILKVRKMEYLEAATAINCSNGRIISRHVIPNSFSASLVQATMGVGDRILSAAALSFLGLGVQPPLPEWGAMLSDGRNYIASSPWLTLIPGLCIALIVLSLNLMGDGLRDAMDPKLRK